LANDLDGSPRARGVDAASAACDIDVGIDPCAAVERGHRRFARMIG
jgi:hypothetical protein